MWVHGGGMRVAAFLSVRRACGLVRQESEASSRISFEEFSALCRLWMAGRPVRTSDLARWQRVLRPTMTHRANHLEALGLIERSAGSDDRRSVCCSLSGAGARRLEADCDAICGRIGSGRPLSRCTPERMVAVVSAMGQVALCSADLVVLGLLERGGSGMVGELVEELGLLQPTVSMSVASLAAAGLVSRDAGRRGAIGLTEAGRSRADELASAIGSIVVRGVRTQA